MRGLTLLLPAALVLAPADGAQRSSGGIQADTARDSAVVLIDGRPQRAGDPRPACPMPVARGNQAGPMPNLAPPASPAPPDTAAVRDSSYWRVIPIPAPFVERLTDRMPVAPSGCWNPLFPARARPHTWIVLPPEQ
jgi:hypothetical protein